MSKKPGKQAVKEQQKKADEIKSKLLKQTKVLYDINIKVLKNGQMNAGGFPNSVTEAQKIAGDFNALLMNYFVQAASAGHVDEKGIVKQNRIITDLPKNIMDITGKKAN